MNEFHILKNAKQRFSLFSRYYFTLQFYLSANGDSSCDFFSLKANLEPFSLQMFAGLFQFCISCKAENVSTVISKFFLTERRNRVVDLLVNSLFKIINFRQCKASI